ncbi:hypothetical protein C8Q78DRAFT_831258 [Trametes maxima]|nr:hypothetical protein C8Q78DRAFT_831258 [Trametes maxima]
MSNCDYFSLCLTESSTQTYGFGNKTAGSRYPRFAEEGMRTIVGPMPPGQFLDTFLQRQQFERNGIMDDMPSSKNAFIHIPREAKKEEEIYEPLIKALNKSIRKKTRCPGFSFRNTSSRADESGGKVGSVKPDLCCYADRHLEMVSVTSTRPASWRTDMGLVATFIEVKPRPGLDFFRDPPLDDDDVDRDNWVFTLDHITNLLDHTRAEEALGQNIAYTAELFARQHRWFCFSVSLAGSRARLFRWDRSGVVVTRAFDLRDNPAILCEFLWCFAHLPETGRGYDMTVQPATPKEAKSFRDAIMAHASTQLALQDPDAIENAVKEHCEPGVVAAIQIPDSERPARLRRFLVSRPIFFPLSAVGRSSRLYWAVDVDTWRVFLLKDTWRYNDGTGHSREGHTLTFLHLLGVPNIPRVETHGDVPEVVVFENDDEGTVRTTFKGHYITNTQNLLGEAWVCNRSLARKFVVERRHYRLVMDAAGYPLFRLTGSAELFHATYDAFEALHQAHIRDHGRVHREITPGSIILYRERTSGEDSDGSPKRLSRRRGYLVNWDVSRNNTVSYFMGPAVSGAWPFAAYDVLSARNTKYTIQYDMESVYFVVLYCAYCWLPHDLSPKHLLSRLQEVFDYIRDRDVDGTPIGGAGKANLFQSQNNGHLWGTKGVGTWLEAVLDLRPLHNSKTTPAQTWDSWNLSGLDLLWQNFLRTETLRDDDRTENLDQAVFAQLLPRIAQRRPFQPTIPSNYMAVGRKRTSSEVSLEGCSEPRRQPGRRLAKGPGQTQDNLSPARDDADDQTPNDGDPGSDKQNRTLRSRAKRGGKVVQVGGKVRARRAKGSGKAKKKIRSGTSGKA